LGVQGLGFRVWGLGFRLWVLGSRFQFGVSGFWFMIHDLGSASGLGLISRGYGLGLKVQGLGFVVYGLQSMVCLHCSSCIVNGDGSFMIRF